MKKETLRDKLINGINYLGLAMLGLLGLKMALSNDPQNDDKLRNDPTYSIHNYKQPNKAATALRWAMEGRSKKGQELKRIPIRNNYKRQQDRDTCSSAVVLPVEPGPSQNYKMPMPARPKSH